MDITVASDLLSEGGKAAGVLGTALSSFKTVKELAKASKDSALKTEITNLHDSLLDLREAINELQTENERLKAEATAKASVKRSGEFGYYFAEGETDPLCPTCVERDGKHIHLSRVEDWNGGTRRFCPVCVGYLYEKPMQTKSVTRRPYRGHDPYAH